MLEQEYKIMLTKEQYDSIESYFDFTDERIQINHYYDSTNFDMIKNGFTVRVRELNGKRQILQIKKSLDSKIDGVKVRNEFEKEIFALPKEICLSSVENLINEKCKVDFSKLENIGSLITKRKILKIQNCEISLDKNDYLGKIDYELEIEFNGAHFKAFQILKELGLENESTAMGKNKRFLKEKLKKH